MLALILVLCCGVEARDILDPGKQELHIRGKKLDGSPLVLKHDLVPIPYIAIREDSGCVFGPNVKKTKVGRRGGSQVVMVRSADLVRLPSDLAMAHPVFAVGGGTTVWIPTGSISFKGGGDAAVQWAMREGLKVTATSIPGVRSVETSCPAAVFRLAASMRQVPGVEWASPDAWVRLER